MKKYALIGVFLLAQVGYVSCGIFPTLTQVQQYAKLLPEHVETETDWLNPDFSSFHKELAAGVSKSITQLLLIIFSYGPIYLVHSTHWCEI